MELLELMKYRRSIRKYEDRQIEKEALEKVIEAGLFAPNAGGGQRSMIVGVRNKDTVDLLGRVNLSTFDRSRLMGPKVSVEQPSIIDDPTMKSAFYGAPAVCIVFARKNFLYSVPDAFCCAENMVLEATELGLASCIIARAEATFATPEGQELQKKWGVPEEFEARCFVLLGYNAALMVKSGIGCAIGLDRIINTTETADLCFRPFDPPLEAGSVVIWKKYQILSKPAEMLLERMMTAFEK